MKYTKKWSRTISEIRHKASPASVEQASGQKLPSASRPSICSRWRTTATTAGAQGLCSAFVQRTTNIG